MTNLQRGYCLNSQEIRDKIANGSLTVSNSANIEKRIQPASFDPTLGDEVFILETETGGLFRPTQEEPIYKTLLRLPIRQRERVKTEGFQINKGYTYLIPLEERLSLAEGESVRSSPKSSIGRMFVNTRLLADYNPSFDEINPIYRTRDPLQLWLLVQPLAFNAILHPGLSLNQLRFFNGIGAQLTEEQMHEELEKNPLLFERQPDGQFTPLKPIITSEGVQVQLDLRGRYTDGIVALRARHNPTPIDLAKVGQYQAEGFLEPLKNKNGRVEIATGEHYLIASREVLKIPSHLSAELKRTSGLCMEGNLHYAGFIDSGFEGDLVFEVKSGEPNNVVLSGETIPVSTLQLFSNHSPDKLYGRSIGSHYHGQLGAKPAKFFGEFDYARAARDYKKLSRDVLVQDAKLLHKINSGGFKPLSSVHAAKLQELVKEGFFHSRYDCETDEDILQIIPYIVAFDKDDKVFSYVRANNIEDYGDERLFGKHSIGVGGHIAKTDDSRDYLRSGLARELREEVHITGMRGEPALVGTLVANDNAVDRVHFGLVYTLHCDTITRKEASLESGRPLPIEELMADPLYGKKYETWSRILIEHLPTLVRA